MSFSSMASRKVLTYSFSNDTSDQSYGCKDYMPKLFEKYIIDVLDEDESSSPATKFEESKGGSMLSPILS